MRRVVASLTLAFAVASVAAGPAWPQKAKLIVYTALENDRLALYGEAVKAAVPEAELIWVRDSTGVIAARFLAEKNNPRADIKTSWSCRVLRVPEPAI
ncbi:MAG: hypothetical protein ACREC6_14590 [Hyphomicrobiaceae bacterium]